MKKLTLKASLWKEAVTFKDGRVGFVCWVNNTHKHSVKSHSHGCKQRRVSYRRVVFYSFSNAVSELLLGRWLRSK